MLVGGCLLLAGCGGSSKSSSASSTSSAGKTSTSTSGSASTSANTKPPTDLSTKVVSLMAKDNPELKNVRPQCPSSSSFPIHCHFTATETRRTLRSYTLVHGHLTPGKPVSVGTTTPTPVTGTVTVLYLTPVPRYNVAYGPSR